MEGQGEAMLEPEGETYDESQQVITLQYAKCTHGSALSSKYHKNQLLNWTIITLQIIFV